MSNNKTTYIKNQKLDPELREFLADYNRMRRWSTAKVTELFTRLLGVNVSRQTATHYTKKKFGEVNTNKQNARKS